MSLRIISQGKLQGLLQDVIKKALFRYHLPLEPLSPKRLKAILQAMMPLELSQLASRRWITFRTLERLRKHGRVTYYVRVKADEEDDVRFKVLMTADELRGPVIETESTHLFN